MSTLWEANVAPYRKISRIFFWRKSLAKDKKFIFDFAMTNAESDEFEPPIDPLEDFVHPMVTSSFLPAEEHSGQNLYRT